MKKIKDKQHTYYIKQEYKGNFDKAVVSITKALQEQGFGILTKINVKETLKKKLNVNYPNYVILGACNPQNAYKALEAEKEIGLLLPCNVIVYEKNKKVYIDVIKPTTVLTLSKSKKIVKVAKEVELKLITALQKATKSERNKK